METVYINALLSFVVAGTWISLSTWLAERLGTKTGGVIALLPSTILVSLLFVALTVNKDFAADAALSVPLGMAINSIFLTAFVFLLRMGLVKATAVSLVVWGCCALFFRQLQIESVIVTTIIFGVVMSTSYYILEHVAKIRSVAKRDQKFRVSLIFYRALFAGTVVGSTVIISRFAGHFWTGIFSTFPAVMLTSMVILTRAQGADFARATAKTMILSSGNIVVYAFAVNYLYKTMSLGLATLLAFILAILFLVLLSPLLARSK
jgi:uncharacterized membrane protein (GlpM family)